MHQERKLLDGKLLTKTRDEALKEVSEVGDLTISKSDYGTGEVLLNRSNQTKDPSSILTDNTTCQGLNSELDNTEVVIK